MEFREIKFDFELDDSVLNDNKYDIFLRRNRINVVNLMLFLLPISLGKQILWCIEYFIPSFHEVGRDYILPHSMTNDILLSQNAVAGYNFLARSQLFHSRFLWYKEQNQSTQFNQSN